MAEYIKQFCEFRMRCLVVEDEKVTLIRFIDGLHFEIVQEIVNREITSFGHARNFALKYKSQSRFFT